MKREIHVENKRDLLSLFISLLTTFSTILPISRILQQQSVFTTPQKKLKRSWWKNSELFSLFA